jgi:hypothetical protein
VPPLARGRDRHDAATGLAARWGGFSARADQLQGGGRRQHERFSDRLTRCTRSSSGELVQGRERPPSGMGAMLEHRLTVWIGWVSRRMGSVHPARQSRGLTRKDPARLLLPGLLARTPSSWPRRNSWSIPLVTAALETPCRSAMSSGRWPVSLRALNSARETPNSQGAEASAPMPWKT